MHGTDRSIGCHDSKYDRSSTGTENCRHRAYGGLKNLTSARSPGYIMGPVGVNKVSVSLFILKNHLKLCFFF